jgi:hypothetical protein
MAGDQRGLIEAARPDPPAMKRDGDDELRRGSAIGQQPDDMGSHRVRQAQPSAIFEPVSHRAADLAIAQDRPRPIERRRRGEARAAQGALPRCRRGERATAGRALGLAQKVHRRPARGAQRARRQDDHAACRASRRQRIVQHRPDRGLEK